MNDSIEPSALGGTLIRWGKNQWAWTNGDPAPEVSDLTLSHAYNFRCRTLGAGQVFIEVPVKQAAHNPDLQWTRGFDKDLSGDDMGQSRFHADGRVTRVSDRAGGGAIREVYLIPRDEWDARPVVGCQWDRAAEPAIFAKAQTLGWIPS